MATPSPAAQWSGNIAIEARSFVQPALYSAQRNTQLSVAAQPEFYHKWTNDSFTFTPFVRLDEADSERTHADVRELTWLHTGEGHEWRVGIRRIFWGVTESQHLVDIVNQTDLVENQDGEDKLGQPMIDLAVIRPWGTLDLILLPGFRERTFPGIEGRLRTPLPVDTAHPLFESSRGRHHIDWALRWSRSIGDWDIGLSHFDGTRRDPRLLADAQGTHLIPYYDLIRQTGLDIQATKDGWLWKLEGIYRMEPDMNYTAFTGGFEYTLYGLMETGKDLGLITEYLYDERGNDAFTPFQNDIMLGTRLSFNDEQSSEALLGIIADLSGSAHFLNFEASRRFGQNWKLSVEARGFYSIPASDVLYSMRNDDYIQAEWALYF